MGTRINVLLDHKLADWRNRESVLARLATALPAALAVQEYWLSADPRVSHDKLTEWRADPVSPGEPSLRRYDRLAGRDSNDARIVSRPPHRRH